MFQNSPRRKTSLASPSLEDGGPGFCEDAPLLCTAHGSEMQSSFKTQRPKSKAFVPGHVQRGRLSPGVSLLRVAGVDTASCGSLVSTQNGSIPAQVIS